MAAGPEGVETGSKIYHPFQNEGMNFTDFSRHYPYRRENAELLTEAMRYLPSAIAWVDIGSGNGLAAQEAKGMADIFLRTVTMWCIDPDAYALGQAQRNIPSSERFTAFWIKGFGQDIEDLLEGKIPDEGVDVVSILDAVHEFPPDDQFPIIRASARIIKPGGLMAVNSQFTNIATADNEQLWAMPAGRAAIRLGGRSTGRSGLLQRDPKEYTGMGVDAGLEPIYYKEVDVLYPTQALVDINKYPGYVEGVRRGFVFEKGEPTLEELSRELQKTHARCNPLRRKSVRWIFRKPNSNG